MRSRLNLFFRAVLFAFTAAMLAAMAPGAGRPALQPFSRDCTWGDGTWRPVDFRPEQSGFVRMSDTVRAKNPAIYRYVTEERIFN